MRAGFSAKPGRFSAFHLGGPSAWDGVSTSRRTANSAPPPTRPGGGKPLPYFELTPALKLTPYGGSQAGARSSRMTADLSSRLGFRLSFTRHGEPALHRARPRGRRPVDRAGGAGGDCAARLGRGSARPAGSRPVAERRQGPDALPAGAGRAQRRWRNEGVWLVSPGAGTAGRPGGVRGVREPVARLPRRGDAAVFHRSAAYDHRRIQPGRGDGL